MDTSDSSDDDEIILTNAKKKSEITVKKSTKNEQSSTENDEVPATRLTKKTSMKKATSNGRKQTRSKKDKTRGKSPKKNVPEGLDGNYWNDVKSGRHDNATAFNYRQVADNGDTSLDSSSNDDENLLYENETFVTCRSPSDSFYLCQLLQNVYNDTRRIRIRWYSVVGEDGDDTQIGIKTHFTSDYTDTLDPSTILISIPNVIHQLDGTISLKKRDIVETKRLLAKSIRNEALSSDDMMDLSTENIPKKKKAEVSKHMHFQSSNESDNSSAPFVLGNTKRKKVSPIRKKSRKQPPKKRARKTLDEADSTGERRETKDTNEMSDTENEPVKPKKKAKKPATVSKTQLFKVRSNLSLKEDLTITKYEKEPFFEDNLTVPFISSFVHSKLAIRAVILNDPKLLKSLINDVNRVCSVHVKRSLHNDLSALHYAIKNDNIQMLKILLDDIKTPKKNRCPFPTVAMTTQSTGRANIHTVGFRTAPIMASRGAKEGNNALNKDTMDSSEGDGGVEIISYALQNNCSREIYDLLFKTFADMHETIYNSIHKILQAGHRKLAASIIGDIKDNAFHGFNYLHHQVLLYDNEDIIDSRAASVIKKTKMNQLITPIHCAAINPNSKYLKQLLNIIPEYNILDKYERRPIHFAAACEGSDPLEYLLLKQVSFSDVDRGGNSPLHIAVMNGRSINAEILLRTAKDKVESNETEDPTIHEKFGLASINRMNKSRFYPLHSAVLNNHLECVKILLEYGANIDILTSTASGNLTPLMLACQKGYLTIVKHLIDSGAKIEARDRFKRTPLIHACMCGNAHIVSYLLRLGANSNVFDTSLNTTLHYSIAYGWYFCVRLLLEAGANLNCVNSMQTTCLAAGFLKGHYGLCDYLLTEHNIDINFKTDDGLTLVMLTVGLEISSSAVEQLEYVVTKHKADCSSIDGNESNAFHYLAGNTLGQDLQNMEEDDKKIFHDNLFKMAQILLENKCDPNKMNSKAQSPLMIALETGNFLLVDYLINNAKIHINSDVSLDGKTLLHYFAMKCDKYDLIQALLKLKINDEMKKMGQIFDNNGRTPFHYCAEIFDKFCQQNIAPEGTDELKKKYQSIVQMIEYCLESIQCDSDIEIKSTNIVKNSDEENDIVEDEENMSDDNSQKMDDTPDVDNEKSNLILKETSIFSLLRTVPFIDSTLKHPLEMFLKKSKDVNVLHHKTQRTPLLESIHLRQSQTALLLINDSSCNINLSTSIIPNERQQTPLILACKLQLLSVIHSLLEHEQCDILTNDYENNQAIHYYLQTSNRSNEYVDIFKIFIKKLRLISNNQGKHQRTPLHIAVYHNLSAIDAVNDVEQVLIENESDLLMKDNLGNIPLHNVFLNKKIGDDPVELCVLIIKAMGYKSLDTKNNEGDTPLHLAVAKCSTVCIMLLQQHNASLVVENNLSNSIIGTCISSGHLNLFITFLQQSVDIDLGKLHSLPVNDLSTETTEETPPNMMMFYPRVKQTQRLNRMTFRTKPVAFRSTPTQISTEKKAKSSKKNTKDIWKWEYAERRNANEFNQYTLLYLIIERDWQGALSLILNDLDRFHLSYIQTIEGAILNNKLNLVLRLLLRLKDQTTALHESNSQKQNLYHLIANLNQYDEHLLKQILIYFHQYDLDWNTSDQYGIYPLHYACVQQNFLLINFLEEKYSKKFNFNQTDSFGNTPTALLFWSLGHKTSFSNEKIRLLISSGKQLDCLCNYNNEIAIDPLSFGYIPSPNDNVPYPPVDKTLRNIRTSPLIHAIVHNNFQLVKFILELGADVNYPDENKRTPLMYAVRQNNIEIVKLLLNKDYSPEDTETPEDQPFNQRRGKVSRQQFFLGTTTITNTEKPAGTKSKNVQQTSSINLNASDILGQTCIHHLVQPFVNGTYRNNIEILRLLHSCGASLTIAENSGLTPLEFSIENNCQHLCDELTNLMNHKNNSIKAKIDNVSINDPNKKLLDKPNFYNDAQDFIDEYIVSHPPSKHNTAYKVDRSSGMSLTGEVLIDTDKNEPYDARLTKTDVNYGPYGLYNFYRMQIIKHKSKNNLYFLFTRWGRIGLHEGQHQLTPYSTLDECRREFSKVFREKTANLWKDTDQFEAKPKKYTLIPLNQREVHKYSNVPIDFDRLQAEDKHPSSQLQSSVYKDLMRTLIDRQAIRKSIHKTQLDTEWMPVSQLKRGTLEKARALLVKIKENIEEKTKFDSENQQSKTSDQKNDLITILESIYQYTNEYYTLIPLNGYSEEKLSIIDNSDELKKQEKILDDLFELELSYKILLGAQANLNHISPLDYLYKSINCLFQALNKDDMDSQFILRYIWSSSPETKVEQIFQIERSNENERLAKSNIDNHYLLWHGTSICNLISILTRGLLVGSLVATATGSLFGTGIYTADSFAKSLGYCSGVEQNGGERCFMLLCEVALGNIKEVGIREDEDDDEDKPLDVKQFHSRKGVGRQIPDPKHTIVRNSGVQIPLGQLTENKDHVGHYYSLNYNEYIVYDEAQIALRYLVQFSR